jgi:hypothetical protein
MRERLSALAAFCALLVMTSPVFAQQAAITSLVGTITDANRAVIGGATVTAVNDGTQETYTGVTNTRGYYAFQFVKIGSYTISASARGFSTVVKTSVAIETNQVVRTDFSLPIGQVTEKVTVAATVPPVATEEASISEIIGERAMTELPLNGRDALRMAGIVPTVITGMKSRVVATAAGGEDFIGAGTREVQNSINLDGVSIMSNLITTTTLRPSVDAVQEFQIQTGTYSAQYGTHMGVHLNLITKSGSNEPHGAVWEFLRNDKLDAHGFFDDPTRPKNPLRQNQFGGEFGGPVFIPKVYDGRNRSFFMVDYEGWRNSGAQSAFGAVLTPQMRNGDFSQVKTVIKNPLASNAPYPGNIIPASDLSPQAQRVLQFMPTANAQGTNNYLAAVANGDNSNQTIARLDQSIGDKTRLFFRYAWQKATLNTGSSNPNNGFQAPLNDNNYAVGYTQTLSPRLINDLHFGHESANYYSVNYFTGDRANAGTALGIPGFTTGPDNPGIPEFDITSFIPIGGQNMTSSNWYRPDSTWEFTDVLNYSRGAHNVTLGGEFFRLRTGSQGSNFPRGLFNFTGAFSGYAPADLVLGLPLQVTTPAVADIVLAQQWRDAFFVSDKWQVSPRLTATIGFRYELPTVAKSPNGHILELNPAGTALLPPNPPSSIPLTAAIHNLYAPRLGLAWRVTDKWVVRAGGGMYYNAEQMNGYTIAGGNPPFTNRVTYNSTAATLLTLSNPTNTGSLVKSTAPPNINTVDFYLPAAAMAQWSFSVERTLWKDAGLDIQYLGSHTAHLERNYMNNTPLPGPGAVANRRPNPLWGTIRTVEADEIANYNALTVVLRQRTHAGLTMLLSYTWSHALDIGTDSNNSGNGATPQDPYNWRQDYGNSNWDIRHRFVASYNYELPFFKGSNAVMRALLGHWQINGITTLQTGTPFRVFSGGDIANTGAADQRPNLIGPATANCGGGHLTNCFTTSAFAVPALYTYGSADRNILHGPGLVTTDLSLFKNIHLHGEGKILQLRFESFNAFNRPNFANPNGTFGVCSGQLCSGTLTTVGSITSTLIPNRQVQVAAKLLF